MENLGIPAEEIPKFARRTLLAGLLPSALQKRCVQDGV